MAIVSKLKKYIKDKGGLFITGSFDTLFFIFLVTVIGIGLVMLYSATYVYAVYNSKTGDPATYFTSQLEGVAIGGVLMFIISRLNYRALEMPAAVLGTVASVILLIAALFEKKSRGTSRYVYFGSFQFQPSDIAKFALILTLAWLLDRYHNLVVSKKTLRLKAARNINDRLGVPLFNKSLGIILLCGLILIVYAGLVAWGSHLSGTILMLLIGVVMLYLGEIRFKWFIAGTAFAVLAAVAVFKMGLLKDYMMDRIVAWLNKDYSPLGERWQTNQALYAIASGGFFGKGFGASTLKHLYVSEPQNDMIFSIVVEELGFLFSSFIVLLFALLVWRGFVIGINAADRYGSLVAMGISFQLALQLCLNIAVATDSLPNTGISLPFFSYGRTAMVMNMVEMGYLLSISRSSKMKKRI